LAPNILHKNLRDSPIPTTGTSSTRSLIQYVDDLALLSDRMNVIHAVWIDDIDIGLLAKARAQVIHNPISNLRLGNGVMPFRRLAQAGVSIALGSDEIIADDAVNLWSVMKTAALIHTIGDPDPDRWPVAGEILKCMFEGGATAMRQADRLGRIAPGFQADLIMLDLDALPFTPLNDQTAEAEGLRQVRRRTSGRAGRDCPWRY
jgi:cytosine/adenosine deaminase-related metal-dependent hydrolase